MAFSNYLWALIFWTIPFQESPTFYNGKQTLQEFVNQHIIYPNYSKANCIQATISVTFNVNSEGKVSRVYVSDGPGIDLDEEAIRVIKLTDGKWQVKNTRYKIWQITLPIKFALEEPRCQDRNKAETNNAIAYYQIQEQLQNTVFEYYKKKAKGENNPKDEPHIIKLKQELGFDDEFIETKLAEARKMIKQNDTENTCKTLLIIKNIGSDAADKLIEEFCK
ncbi:TonB family protein [Pseudopedobacter saltans DSM 12145]|uniref:TonB family protein n=1 Tax=Pseudopedobacter saltans (strain ATCC 51119 / DSM 12145 / JCM 21818 / CCUG 39354 / LMG 10337 / NBRC 100064 / NCIMB 13643) TaxID=762903 RepID=F0SA25_PSESL|nr:TonB family protein [Pseudopedobacter saltans]ADY53589.1 TonB family protein [Pseudopedobacter saltans DSM 12145]